VKMLSRLLALLNALVAVQVMASSLSADELRDASPSWLFTKLSGAMIVIAIGAMSWLGGSRAISRPLILAAGAVLIALGTAAAVWTVHLAQVTGDMEAYMVVYGCSLLAQGLSLLWDSQTGGNTASSMA